MITLADPIEYARTCFGDRVAVVDGDLTLTYAQLAERGDRLAAGLAELGVRGGDRVALLAANGHRYLEAFFGVPASGVVLVPLNTRLAQGELAHIVRHSGAKVLITDRDPGELAELVEHVVSIPDRYEALVDGAIRLPEAATVLPSDIAALFYTGGTTGLPKGALYCNRQLAFITQTDTGGAWDTGGRSFSGTSFAHLGFMTKLPGSLQRGGTTFIMERWRAGDALELLAREKMTTVAGVPTQLALMLRRPDFDSFDLSSVRFIIAGGGPVTPGLADEARRRFGAALATRYSCTEAGIGLGTAFDDPEEDAVVSVGRPHASVELALVDGDDHPVPAGEVGEVCLRSPAVMSGYWRDPEQSRAAFTADGFVRTGDLGWLDDRGRLRLVGRSKEMYVRGGYNVYPVEVESVLSTHPELAAIAIVPRADDVMGEIGVAVVVPRDPARVPTLDELRAFAETQVAAYKLPEELAVRAELPLTPMEKIDRRALVAELNDLVT